MSQNFKTFLSGFAGGLIGAFLVIMFFNTSTPGTQEVFTTQSVGGNGRVMLPPTKDDTPRERVALEGGSDDASAGLDQLDTLQAQLEADLQAESEKQFTEAEAQEANEIAANPDLAKKANEPFAEGKCAEDDQECLIAGCAATDIPQKECEALVDLFYSTNGTAWEWGNLGSKWLTNNSACSWQGVSCQGGSVRELYLGHTNLSGPIPSSLGNLSNLRYLNLNFNKLTGPIPSSLGNLPNLGYLYLAANQLSGPIPSSLGNLYLVELNLNTNQLSGPIPSSLGFHTSLKDLLLGYNQLSGPIPSSLDNLSNLKVLFLEHNKLSGPIPSSLANLKSSILLGENQLCGKLPNSFMIKWPNGIPYRYEVGANQLMTTGYDPAMTNWLQATNFQFGSQASTDCGIEKDGENKQ